MIEIKAAAFVAMVFCAIMIVVVLIVGTVEEKKRKKKIEDETKAYNNKICTRCGTELKIIKTEVGYGDGGSILGKRTYLCPECNRSVNITTEVDLDPETGLYGYVKPENHEIEETKK